MKNNNKQRKVFEKSSYSDLIQQEMLRQQNRALEKTDLF